VPVARDKAGERLLPLEHVIKSDPPDNGGWNSWFNRVGDRHRLYSAVSMEVRAAAYRIRFSLGTPVLGLRWSVRCSVLAYRSRYLLCTLMEFLIRPRDTLSRTSDHADDPPSSGDFGASRDWGGPVRIFPRIAAAPRQGIGSPNRSINRSRRWSAKFLLWRVRRSTYRQCCIWLMLLVSLPSLLLSWPDLRGVTSDSGYYNPLWDLSPNVLQLLRVPQPLFQVIIFTLSKFLKLFPFLPFYCLFVQTNRALLNINPDFYLDLHPITHLSFSWTITLLSEAKIPILILFKQIIESYQSFWATPSLKRKHLLQY